MKVQVCSDKLRQPGGNINYRDKVVKFTASSERLGLAEKVVKLQFAYRLCCFGGTTYRACQVQTPFQFQPKTRKEKATIGTDSSPKLKSFTRGEKFVMTLNMDPSSQSFIIVKYGGELFVFFSLF